MKQIASHGLSFRPRSREIQGAQQSADGDDEQLRVYLAEDSSIVLQRLTERASETGARIVGHSDTAADALRDIFRLAPHVVIVDVALRDGTGFDILSGLMEVRPPDLRYRIVLTNYALPGYRQAAQRLQADAFFDKGSEIQNLLRLIQHLQNQAASGKALVPY